MSSDKRISFLILSLAILIIIAHHVFGYIGHYGFDDLYYARLANDLRNGIINYDDQYSYRLTILSLTALSYSIFGISDLASALPTMLVSISIIILVYHSLKDKGHFIMSLGLSLVVFSHWFLFYSDKIMPDIYIAFSVFLAVFIINKYKYESNKKNPFLYALLLSLALFFGFISKGTIVLIIPLLIYFVIIDIYYNRDLRFWLYSILSGSLIIISYFLLIKLLTGNISQRFEAIAGNSYLNLCSYDQQPFIITLKRISYGFLNMMTYQSMLTSFIILIPFIFKKKALEYLKLNDSFSFYVVSSLLLLLSSNFMTISMSSYVPMCLDPRHFMFLTPVVAIPAAIILFDHIKERRRTLKYLLASSVIMGLSYFLQGDSFWRLYLPLTLIFGIDYLFRKRQDIRIAFVLSFIFILSFQFLGMLKYAGDVKYRKQKMLFTEQILDRDSNYYLISNEVQKRLAYYYSDFNLDNDISFLSYNRFDTDSLDNRDKFLFLNWYTRYLSNYDYYDLPYYARNAKQANKLIFEDSELNIAVYKLDSLMVPSLEGKNLVHSFNEFETEQEHWDYNGNGEANEIKVSGERSVSLNEFSPVFSYELDSLSFNKENKLQVGLKLYCYFTDKPDAKLVVSIEDKTGVYFWQGKEVNKSIKAYSNWWPVGAEIDIRPDEIKKGSTIKAYLWNTGRTEAYIDDFTINITEMEY